MRIKVGNKVYSSEDQPIMVILTDQDKENINNMPKDAYRYCQYNTDKYDAKYILEWMDELGDLILDDDGMVY